MTQISPIFVLRIQIFDGNLAWTSVRGLARGNGLHSGLLIVMHQWLREPMGSHGSEVHPLLFFLSFWDLKTLLFPCFFHSSPTLPSCYLPALRAGMFLSVVNNDNNNKTRTCPPVCPPLLKQCCVQITNLGLPVILTQPMAPCGLGNAWFLCFCHSLSSQGD